MLTPRCSWRGSGWDSRLLRATWPEKLLLLPSPLLLLPPALLLWPRFGHGHGLLCLMPVQVPKVLQRGLDSSHATPASSTAVPAHIQRPGLRDRRCRWHSLCHQVLLRNTAHLLQQFHSDSMPNSALSCCPATHLTLTVRPCTPYADLRFSGTGDNLYLTPVNIIGHSNPRIFKQLVSRLAYAPSGCSTQPACTKLLYIQNDCKSVHGHGCSPLPACAHAEPTEQQEGQPMLLVAQFQAAGASWGGVTATGPGRPPAGRGA